MGKIYGYARISRPTQNIERQIRNIESEFENAIIFKEAYTGTKTEGRTEWNKLLKKVKKGDTIIFDSVSRMSRNAEEGISQYFELFNKGVNLIFLKERTINTDTYKQASRNEIKLSVETGDEIIDDFFNDQMKSLNKLLSRLAGRQIRQAFEQAQKEVDDLHVRTKEGIETAKKKGKQIGQVKGNKLKVKKEQPIKDIIRECSKAFDGNLKDDDVIAIINSRPTKDDPNRCYHISRNTYYKYKSSMQATV